MDENSGNAIIPVEKWGELKKLFETDLPIPFAQEIMLFDCHVAGTGYVKDILALTAEIQEGSLLALQREPNNTHDQLAITVRTEQGAKLGYVPRAWNTIPAHLLDAGKMLFAKVVKKELHDEWLKIQI